MSAVHPVCDIAAIQARPGGKQAHPRLVLAATILASSLAFIDGSVVNVGLPAIARSLHTDAGALPWVINAYLLPMSALLLFGGAAGDRFGRRRLLIAGSLLFALASGACALAPNLTILLIGRGIQGIGAAILTPNSLAILGDAFSGEARGRAIGTWAAAGAMAGAVGPILGGGLIDLVGWRAIFLLNVPVAAGAVFLAWRFVREARDGQVTPLDWMGSALATLGLGALTWGLTIGAGPNGWTLAAAALVAGGFGFIMTLILVEHRRGDRAMMPLTLFASREFVGLTLLTLLDYGALGCLLVLVPYELIERSHYSAVAAGAALMPFPLIVALMSPLVGGLAGRIGARPPLIIGSMVVGVGFLLAMRIGSDGGYWSTVLPAILVISLGMAGVAAPLTTAVLSSVDARHTGSASGLNSAVARTGGLIATALLGAILAASGAALASEFRVAMFVGALAAVCAAVCGLLVRPAVPHKGRV